MLQHTDKTKRKKSLLFGTKYRWDIHTTTLVIKRISYTMRKCHTQCMQRAHITHNDFFSWPIKFSNAATIPESVKSSFSILEKDALSTLSSISWPRRECMPVSAVLEGLLECKCFCYWKIHHSHQWQFLQSWNLVLLELISRRETVPKCIEKDMLEAAQY